MEKNTDNWYILRSKSNKEKSVAETLYNEMTKGDLMGKISNVLVPTEKVTYIRSGKKVKREQILFPGYIFVQVIALGEVKQFIRMMPDCSGFLTDRNKNITKVSTREIDRIFNIMEESENRNSEPMYKIGDEINIIEGPFNKMKGQIYDMSSNKVKVNVSIFGRNTPIELDFEHIERKA